ncbi:Hypothetical predicted protein [Cloeon dipterum]|uniref:Macro domain-containing protein n=1 Tax=Cloeon dipterum TaxID=197152 RepID=A0A8S1CN02_9INSE|nr:Hypothetical predicted protein [Cloeon dipterum]
MHRGRLSTSPPLTSPSWFFLVYFTFAFPAFFMSRQERFPSSEYQKYLRDVDRIRRHGIKRPSGSRCSIKVSRGDLFKCPGVKAQAVGADFAMGAGLALLTRQLTGWRPEALRRKHPRADLGYVAVERMPDNTEMLLCVSKPRSTQKLHHDPDGHIRGVHLMISGLARYARRHRVRELYLPRICSGLDGVDQDYVLEELHYAFASQRISIHVLDFAPGAPRPRAKPSRSD